MRARSKRTPAPRPAAGEGGTSGGDSSASTDKSAMTSRSTDKSRPTSRRRSRRRRRRATGPTWARSSRSTSSDTAGLTMPPAATDWISLEEAAEILSAANVRFRPATIGGWARAGKVQSIKLGGRRFVRRGEIRALIARRGVSAPPTCSPACSRTFGTERDRRRPDRFGGLRRARGDASLDRPAVVADPACPRPLRRGRRRAARRRPRLRRAVRDRPGRPAARRRRRPRSSPIRSSAAGLIETVVGVLPPMRELIEVVLTEAARDAAPVSILGAVVLVWGTSRFAVAFEGAIARVMGGDRRRGLLAREPRRARRRRPDDRRDPGSPASLSGVVAFLEAAEALGVIPFAGGAVSPGTRCCCRSPRRSVAVILVYRVVPAPTPRWRAVARPGDRRRARPDHPRPRVRVPRAEAHRRGGAARDARDGVRRAGVARAVVPGAPARRGVGPGSGRAR